MTIQIAISRCLLGDEVRYDGTARTCIEIKRYLGKEFEIIPYCPEVAIGMGVPRPAIRLDDLNHNVRARRVADTAFDYTEALTSYAVSFIDTYTDLAGVISKKGSPSCGYLNAKLYKNDELISTNATGIFIKELVLRLPELPIIDEVSFRDCEKREQFLEAVKLKRP